MPRGVYERKSKADQTVELAYWASVQNSKDVADLEDYLEKFPEGAFADLANRRIKQLLAAEAGGGKPEDYDVSIKSKHSAVVLPQTPMPVISGEVPRYQLLAPFFAENNTYYEADKEIEYLGPPNEHMFPLNDSAKAAKREQEEYLDACWAVKCRVEGRPAIPRPKELADQIQASREELRGNRGVVNGPDLPPTVAKLMRDGPSPDPRASRIGSVKSGTAFAERPANAPLLGRDGHRYQTMVDPTKPVNPAHAVTAGE